MLGNHMFQINRKKDQFLNQYHSLQIIFLYKVEMDYDQWQTTDSIKYDNPNSKISIKSKGKSNIVEKKVILNERNKKYTELQVKIMKSIDSPYVVKYLKHIENPENKTVFIYMPYYSRGDLQGFLLKNPKLDFNTRIRMFVDILKGLLALHTHFIIHRDLKLKNIFIDGQGRCVVGDLGIATVTEKSAISAIGTIGNQAPEVYSYGAYDEKVDIWAMGIIGYELFNNLRNNKIPFPFESSEKMQEVLLENGGGLNYQAYFNITNKVKPFDSHLPDKLVDLLMKMLKNNPRERIGWIQFYESEVLFEYSQDEQLLAFRAEYKCMAETKETIKYYIKSIEEFRENYFEKLDKILSNDNVQNYKMSNEYFRNNMEQVHIFLYLELRKVISRYNYIKEKKIYRAIIELSQFIQKVKNLKHIIQQRINISFIQNKQTEIAKNQKYLNSQCHQKLKKIVDQLFQRITL